VSRRLEKAHLVISRAGASSVAELAAAARPAILVPLPGSIDDHQVANANAFERAGGGWVIAQAEGAARLSEKLSQLMASPEMLARAANLAMSAGRTDAAARLADAVSELSPTKAIAKSLEILV